MHEPIATVFGGTGFLGKYIVTALLRKGFHVRVASRHPAPETDSRVKNLLVDVRDAAAVQKAVAGARGVVNAVSLFVEKDSLTFEAIHVEAAAQVARLAREAGASRMLHISGIGVDAHSNSPFISARARGEQAVQDNYPGAIMVRPSVLFGPRDAFVSSLVAVSRAPIIPLFGTGTARLQPAFVEDVARACARILAFPQSGTPIFELGGARIYTYRQAVELVLAYKQRKRHLMPVSFQMWKKLVKLMQWLPNPPLTLDQLTLLEMDNVVGEGVQTFADLQIQPESLESALPHCLP